MNSGRPAAGETVDRLDPGRLLPIVGKILGSNPYGFLISHAPGGHTRLVHHLDTSDSTELWIGTSPRSRKVSDVRATPEVTYAVEDRKRFAYVALYCKASVVDDSDTLETRWVPTLATFFPAGPHGGDFALLRLTPRRIELMTFADAVHPDPFGLVPAALTRDDPSAEWREIPAERSTGRD